MKSLTIDCTLDRRVDGSVIHSLLNKNTNRNSSSFSLLPGAPKYSNSESRPALGVEKSKLVRQMRAKKDSQPECRVQIHQLTNGGHDTMKLSGAQKYPLRKKE